MGKVNVCCALPSQMVLEPTVIRPRRKVDVAASTLQAKPGKRYSDRQCQGTLVKLFGTRYQSVAVVAHCWNGDVYCVRAYIRCEEYLIEFKNGLEDPKPKTSRVIE